MINFWRFHWQGKLIYIDPSKIEALYFDKDGNYTIEGNAFTLSVDKSDGERLARWMDSAAIDIPEPDYARTPNGVWREPEPSPTGDTP